MLKGPQTVITSGDKYELYSSFMLKYFQTCGKLELGKGIYYKMDENLEFCDCYVSLDFN